jgi:hypothetical protein
MVFTLADLGKLLCTNFKTLFALLDPASKADDMILQFPQSSGEMYLDAGKTWSYSSTAGRRLMYITVSVPACVLVEIFNNSNVIMWFTNEAGTMQLDNGLLMNEYTIQATNTGDEAARWSCRLIFA